MFNLSSVIFDNTCFSAKPTNKSVPLISNDVMTSTCDHVVDNAAADNVTVYETTSAVSACNHDSSSQHDEGPVGTVTDSGDKYPAATMKTSGQHMSNDATPVS
jgi:hypothetical protein